MSHIVHCSYRYVLTCSIEIIESVVRSAILQWGQIVSHCRLLIIWWGAAFLFIIMIVYNVTFVGLFIIGIIAIIVTNQQQMGKLQDECKGSMSKSLTTRIKGGLNSHLSAEDCKNHDWIMPQICWAGTRVSGSNNCRKKFQVGSWWTKAQSELCVPSSKDEV